MKSLKKKPLIKIIENTYALIHTQFFEVCFVLIIIISLITIGTILYLNASKQNPKDEEYQKISEHRDQIKTIIKKTEAAYITENSYLTLNNKIAIRADIFPETMINKKQENIKNSYDGYIEVDGTEKVTNPWKGSIQILGTKEGFTIISKKIPKEACIDLLTKRITENKDKGLTPTKLKLITINDTSLERETETGILKKEEVENLCLSQENGNTLSWTIY